jgi:hypothetical protein
VPPDVSRATTSTPAEQSARRSITLREYDAKVLGAIATRREPAAASSVMVSRLHGSVVPLDGRVEGDGPAMITRSR